MTYLDLDETDKEIMADILANIEDWAEEGEDLRVQFSSAVRQNKPSINSDFLNYLFDCFFNVETLIRHSPRFNHIAFIEDKIEAFTSLRLH